MADDDAPLIISPESFAEVEAMAERDRLAGGPPWEVPDHPDNSLPGGWHHGQITLGRDVREDAGQVEPEDEGS